MSSLMKQQLGSLNDKQLEAVTHRGNRLLLLSGAGSGKTRVITTRIAWLVNELGYSPSSILAVTFTNKAAREMKERLEPLVNRSDELTVRTFHSFGAWLLRRNGKWLDLPQGFTIYDDQDSLALLKTLMGKATKSEYKRYLNAISRCKDFCLNPSSDTSEISHDPDFPKIFEQYEKKLRDIGNVDFGDLISLPVKLLEENTEIRERIRQRFKVILVDEYQDSNYAQFQLLQQLTGEETQLCVVGDDDQSIYKFRGALVENIIEFPQIFPGTKIIKLEQNYRSTNRILRIATEVIQQNLNRMGKTMWSDKPDGLKAQVTYLTDQEQEGQYCTELLAGGNWRDTAILYRTNAQSRVFEKWLRKYQIPYRIVGAISFYAREEIKDALAYLRLLVNPRDEISLQRIINKPARGIGKSSQQKIFDDYLYNGGDLLETLGRSNQIVSGKAKKGCADLLSVLKKTRDNLNSVQLSDVLSALLEDSGLLKYYTEKDQNDFTQKTANLEELVSAALEFQGNEEGLFEFLELITLDQSAVADMEEDKSPEEKVTLITMHNTKGLEFNRVIVSGLEEGLFPRGNDDDPDEIEEERRLFYVAITRAKSELHLLSCGRRLIFGKYDTMAPSRFLKELPEEDIKINGDPPVESDFGEGETGQYSPGTLVYHDDYGQGVINKTVKNSGHTVIIVRFESGRTATILPEFSGHKLEILGRAEW